MLLNVLMDLASALRLAGFAVEVTTRPDHEGPDAFLTVGSGRNKRIRFAVEEKARVPYPNELPQLEPARKRASSFGHPLLLVPFVSENLASYLNAAEWSWADSRGNFHLSAPEEALLLHQRLSNSPPKRVARGLPQGSGALGIIRALIRFPDGEEEDVGVTGLAAQAGVSQPRASQVIGQLHGLKLVTKSPRGRWVPRRGQLLDRFLADYRGPGGSEQHLYSLDEPIDVAIRVAGLSSQRHPIAVSADVGPDLLVPWRRPSMLIVYAMAELPLATLHLTGAQGRHDANVLVRRPADTSVFRDSELVADVRGVKVPLVDESQLIWDLLDLGGGDRLEAAGRLREWLLNHP